MDLLSPHQELGLVQKHLHGIYERLAVEYGDSSMAASRAYEAEASVQRLIWQVDRQANPDPSLEAMFDAVDAHLTRP